MTKKQIFVKLKTDSEFMEFKYCGYFTPYMNKQHREERINQLKEKYPDTEIWIVEIKQVVNT